MALALTGFSVAAGALLGWVNSVTAEPIAQANAKTLSDAIAVVVPPFDNDPAASPETVEVEGSCLQGIPCHEGRRVCRCCRRIVGKRVRRHADRTGGI